MLKPVAVKIYNGKTQTLIHSFSQSLIYICVTTLWSLYYILYFSVILLMVFMHVYFSLLEDKVFKDRIFLFNFLISHKT